MRWRATQKEAEFQAAVQDAVKNAVADVTNQVTLSAHMVQCEKDKAELKETQKEMHRENGERFAKLEGSMDSLKATIDTQKDRINKLVWSAAGAISVVHFLLSDKLPVVAEWLKHL